MSETRRKPGPRRALTEQEILDAALALLDAGGAGAASIRRIAAAVGVAPNAVYTYFPDKAAVERALVERILAEVAGAPDDDEANTGAAKGGAAEGGWAEGGWAAEGGAAEGGWAAEGGAAKGGWAAESGGGASGGGWREQVEALAIDLRRQLIAHPGAVPLMLGGPMDGPNALRLGEVLLDLLAASGLDPASAARGSYLLMVYVLGAVALEVADVPPGMLPPEAERIAARRAALSEVPAQAFPRTAAATGVMATWVGTDQFRWGLRRVLDGLQTVTEGG